MLTEWYPSPEQPVWGAFVSEHARALATRHDVVVVVLPSGRARGRLGWSLEERTEAGLPTTRVRASGRAARLVGAVAALRRVRPDIVHAHVFGPGAVALAAGKLLRVPVVVSEHESRLARGLLSWPERRLARLVYSRADAVCPVSRDLAARIGELAPRARLEVLPNPVDTDLFRPSPPPPAPPTRALCVAGLVPVKAVPDLLDAVALVRSRGRDLVLDVVGDGPERAACEARVRTLDLGSAVRLRGALPRKEVAEATAACRFLCLASRWENLPVVVLEALASGRPVVATRVGGVAEAVGPEDGILVPSGDPEALASALAAMCDRAYDPDRIAARARDRFSLAAVAARATEIYAEALARR